MLRLLLLTLVLTGCYHREGEAALSPAKSLFMGHSFLKPFAEGLEGIAPEGHTQTLFFVPSDGGTPEALWASDTNRRDVQAVIDSGIDLFGMTYKYTYPEMGGYIAWADYALSANPDTAIFISTTWPRYPEYYTSQEFRVAYKELHMTIHRVVDNLRLAFPSAEIFCIPVGTIATDIHPAGFIDFVGHPDEAFATLGAEMWRSVIYGSDV
jgi:hypothetical protein